MTVIIRVKGVKETSKALGRIATSVPRLSYPLAKDVVRGAKFRITNRLGSHRSRGKMKASLNIEKIGKGRHRVVAGGTIAPHFGLQEFGGYIEGKRFVWRKGKGRHGEGYMIPAPMTSIRRGHFPLTDATLSTERRSGLIVLRELEKEIRKVGL